MIDMLACLLARWIASVSVITVMMSSGGALWLWRAVWTKTKCIYQSYMYICYLVWVCSHHYRMYASYTYEILWGCSKNNKPIPPRTWAFWWIAITIECFRFILFSLVICFYFPLVVVLFFALKAKWATRHTNKCPTNDALENNRWQANSRLFFRLLNKSRPIGSSSSIINGTAQYVFVQSIRY